MKRRPPSHGRAFTLVELLSVVTIIVILAALVLTGFGYFNRQQAEKKARLQLTMLASALEDFRKDHGFYPPLDLPPGGTATEKYTNGTGAGTSNDLYQALYGNGAAGRGRIYLPDLDPASAKQGWIDTGGGALKIVDPFGNEYQFRKIIDKSKQRNPDFDLWSSGADGKTSAVPYDPAHRDNRDDLW